MAEDKIILEDLKKKFEFYAYFCVDLTRGMSPSFYRLAISLRKARRVCTYVIELNGQVLNIRGYTAGWEVCVDRGVNIADPDYVDQVMEIVTQNERT